MSWIICDGDVDPEWVESLNSVLDDNGLLTLPSGERIRFGGNVTFIFETHDLSCASPATVSRTGIVFINDEMLGAEALTKTWLLKQPKEHRQFLSDMLNMAFYQCLSWVETKVIFSLLFPHMSQRFITRECTVSTFRQTRHFYK